MASLRALPAELVIRIADMSTWGCSPSPDCHPASYANGHASLARTCRHFHSMLNKGLYVRNIKCDRPSESALLWGATRGSLGTVKLAINYGADPNMNGPDEVEYLNDDSWTYALMRSQDTLQPYGSPLHHALKNNHEDIADYLLDRGVFVDAPSRGLCNCDASGIDASGTPYGPVRYNPLHFAIAHCKSDRVLSKLIHLGARELSRGIYAISALDNAGHHDLVEYIAKKEDRNSACASLLFAATKKDPNLVRRALNNPAADASVGDHFGQTPLHIALHGEDPDLEIIRLLLERPEVDPSACEWQSFTPLHFAVQVNSFEAVALLLEHPRIDVLRQNCNERTAFETAVKERRYGMIKALHARKEFQERDPYCCWVALSTFCGDEETEEMMDIVRFLMPYDLPLRRDDYEPNPFYRSVSSRNFRTALMLFHHGSEAYRSHIKDFVHGDVLHACLQGPHEHQTELVRLLVGSGVPVNHVSLTWQTTAYLAGPPLLVAALGGNVECMEILLQNGAEPNPPIQSYSSKAFSPLLVTIFDHLFKDGPSEEVVKAASNRILILIKYGARLDADNTGTECSLDYAQTMATNGVPLLLELLLSYATKESVSIECLQGLLSKSAETPAFDLLEAAIKRLGENSTDDALGE